MNGYKRLLLLVLIMTAAALITTGAALTILYNTAFEERQARLAETAKSQARLIEAVARFDARFSKATISQIGEVLSNYQQFGETGEFTLARREGDKIVFLLRHHHHVDEPKPIPFASILAEPMRRALSGRSGTVVGLDYRGVMVLAAHEPVAILDLGIVAKIDLAEIRAPFIRAGIIVAAIAVLIVAAGAGIFFLVSDPLIRRIRESEERYRTLVQGQADLICRNLPDGTLLFVNDAYCRYFGKTADELVGTNLLRLIPEESHRFVLDNLASLSVHRPTHTHEHEVTDPNGEIRWQQWTSTAMFDESGEVIEMVAIGHDTTERKQVEEALMEREKRFRAITETANDAIISIDQHGKVIQWNEAAEQIFGYAGSEILGKSLTKIIPKRLRKRHREGVKRHNKTGRSDLLGKTTELQGLRKDGVEFPIELSLSMWKTDGTVSYVGIARDITGRKEAERKLRKLSWAVEQSPASVVITDTEGTIEYVNVKFTEITGYSPEEVIGQNLRILKSGETPDAVYEKLWATIKSGKEWRGTLINKRKDGTVYLAGIAITSIVDSEGTITHFIDIMQDITERVEYERRLKQAEKMEALGGLAGGIAHDFNNMLLPILSLTDMTRKSLPEDSRDRLRLDKVFEAANRAKDLVARILTFSHQENAVRQNIDIHVPIHESMELLRSTLPTTLKITENLKSDTGTVFADSAQISSVLLNLAANAADAMDGKTGEMTVSLSPVKVGKKKAASIPGLHEGKFAKLVVKDNGHGMNEETLALVMDPFFTTKPVGKGTGLGLSMVHGIVSKHGGAVHISSTPGKGTTVEVYLPLGEGEDDHECRDGNGISGDIRKTAGNSRQPEAARKKQAHKH